jgi:alpha-glucosidase
MYSIPRYNCGSRKEMKILHYPGLRVEILFLALLLGQVGITRGSSREGAAFCDLASPDSRIKVSIALPPAGTDAPPIWSVSFSGKEILRGCQLGIQTAVGGDLLAGARLMRERRRLVNKRIPVLFGKADHAEDHFSELRLSLEGQGHQMVDVIFRCYNDAVAFRYEFRKRGGKGSVTIREETTSFGVLGNPTAYVQYLENYKTSHEHNVATTSSEQIRLKTLLDLPLTLQWKDGTCAAITEAALRHYAGMSLMRTSTNAPEASLECRLTPLPDGNKVMRPLPLITPWRVVLIGDRPGALLESSTIYCLNEPSTIKDISWIKPGKITFPWWNGDVFDGNRGDSVLSFGMAKKYIDFCASSGIPTHSLTSDSTLTWYHQSNQVIFPGPDTDVARPREGFDLPTIHRYAVSKNIRLWTWVHQAALRGKLETSFAAFEKMGWSGMMVDFFDHDDQDSVEFAEAILQAAARHHIMIHFHGVWKPTGWQRTYPNLMNHEGALNLEYLKWTDRCTPEHGLMMAFTRLIAGPMDYHLGGFRALTRAGFKPRNIAPNVMGTRGHQLAMYVCFDNPNPMVADYPTAYENQPGFDFLKMVPTWWDETRVIVGDIGEVLVTARRKGSDWYLGCMSAKTARDLDVPLTFLGNGPYTASIWKDAPDAETDPNHLSNESAKLGSSDVVKVHVAMDGGFVVKISPVSK